MHSLDEVALAGTVLGEVVHERKLKDRRENESERHEHEKVQGSGVRNFGQVRACLQAQEGHREHGGDAERDPISGRLPIQPEGHPREHHQQNARPIDLDQEIAHVSLQMEAHHQHRVFVLDWGRE